MEPTVVKLGSFAWILPLVSAIAGIAWSLYYLLLVASLGGFVGYYAYGFGLSVGVFIWDIIAAVIELILLFIYVLRVFVPHVKKMDWEFLQSDSIFNPKFPKMLFFGILLEIFSWYYFGGIFVIICAILIMINAPKNASSASA
jgi:hypothetical protein